MKKAIALFVTTVVLFSGASLFAQDEAPKPEKKADGKMCCIFLEKFELMTKEQKTKAVTLHEACAKEKCSKEAQATFFKAVKEMLTAEQIAACKANCEKNGIKHCPICSEDKAEHQHDTK